MFSSVAALLVLCGAQPNQSGLPGDPGPPVDKCSLIPKVCNESETFNCGPRRLYWWGILDVSECQLPMEVRVGLTVSMTGPRSRNSSTNDILETLRNLSNLSVQVDYVSIGLSFPFCLSFCVMDDESLAWKAVEHYRTFAGGQGHEASMDLMLGPSTSDFRLAAAQVADEFLRPLINWALPDLLGSTRLITGHNTVRDTESWLWQLMATTLSIDAENVFGRLPDDLEEDSCDKLTDLPANYTLRPMAKFLPCNGTCNVSRDLDHCAVPLDVLSVEGLWHPPELLRNGGWHEGCLHIESNGSDVGKINVLLTFDMPRATVQVEYVGATRDSGPLLALANRLFFSSPGEMTLRSGTGLALDVGRDEKIQLSVCLKQDCKHFTCPDGYERAAIGTLCQSATCSEIDLDTCCTQGITPASVNGPFWEYSFRHVLDMSVPAMNWMDSTLPRLVHPRSQFVLCVAQYDDDNIFRDLCNAHINRSLEFGWRSVAQPVPVIRADPGVSATIVQLMLKRPAPTLLIICGDVELYSRFIHGLSVNQVTFQWVTSCIPFGQSLQNKVRGSRLVYNFVEPTPWPSLERMLRLDQVLYAASMRLPVKSFSSVVADNPDLKTDMLSLRSGVQIAFQVAFGAFIGMFTEQAGDAAVAFMDSNADQLSSFSGVEFLLEAARDGRFLTYMGQLNFDAYGRRVILDRHEVGMRQNYPLDSIKQMSDALLVPIPLTWVYQQGRHLFSRYREYDLEPPLEPIYLPLLVDKNSETYPCPPGCLALALQCFSCPVGTFRQASGDSCIPCPPNRSLFQDQWAGDQCFSCPIGGTCDSVSEPPVANAGYIRVPDIRYQETYADLIGPNACSTAEGGGLANVRATDLSRWYAAKSQSSWVIHPCMPPEACIGQNLCHSNHRGPTCSGCAPGSTKFWWYFFELDCTHCPSVAVRILQISVMVVIQVAVTVLLSEASRETAWNEHSLAGPIMFSFVRTLQTHAVLSKLMIEPFSLAVYNEWGGLIWVATISQIAFAPCLLPLASCLIPLESESDLIVYHLLQLASRLGTLLISCLVTVCIAGREHRMNALIRTGYTGLHFALPSLSFFSLMLSRCMPGFHDNDVLVANRDMACTPGLSVVFAVVHATCMILQWCFMSMILKNLIYVHIQDRFGMGIHKLLQGRRWWKVLDDLCIAIPTLFPTTFGVAGMTYCMCATEGGYALLTHIFQAYSFLCGNMMVIFKNSLALNILGVCFGNLFTEFIIGFFTIALDQNFDEAMMISRSVLLILSLVHMLVILVWALIEARVALVFNERLLSSLPTSWTLRVSRFLQCFASFHSMAVQRSAGGQVVFDARGSPSRHRKIFLHGVTSTVNYILYQSTALRFTDVRIMVSEALEQILQARKAETMQRLNETWTSRKIPYITEEEDEEFEELLQSDLVAPHELVCTIEDMCEGSFSKKGKKKVTVAESDDEEPVVVEKRKIMAFGNRKHTAMPKHLRKKYQDAQVECYQTIGSLLEAAELLNRRLAQIWVISTENSDPLIPALLDKGETLQKVVQSVREFLLQKHDARDVEVEQFFKKALEEIREWIWSAEGLVKKNLKDKDPSDSVEAELDFELRDLFSGHEVTVRTSHAPGHGLREGTRVTPRRTPGSPRQRMPLPFNSVDFQSRTQPAPSRHPELDWYSQ